MTNQPDVLILSAGRIPPDVASLFGELPSGMVPINGSPAIAWIIDELGAQGFCKFVIAVGFKKDMIIRFIEKKYDKVYKIEFVEVDYHLGPGNSTITALEHIHSKYILIVLGDTIVREKIDLSKGSFVYTSKEFFDSYKWCLVDYDEHRKMRNIFDKNPSGERAGLEALIGVYYLSDTALLKKIGTDFEPGQRLEISDLLDHYKKLEAIQCIPCEMWLDIGHLDKYHEAKVLLADIRYFNSLEFDTLTGTITKKSLNGEKLRNELQWYLNLPKELSILTPRIIDYSLEKNPTLKMEYYGYPTLSELFVYGGLHIKIWEQILTKLVNILGLFKKYKGDVSLSEYHSIYVNKTKERLRSLATLDEGFKDLVSSETITVNHESLLNINVLWDFIKEEIENLYASSKENNCIIHGDFCFSNILFDPKSGVVRLIDPRGVWDKTFYGDIRYDVAKLSHSIAGKYDFIINDMFYIRESKDNVFELMIYSEEIHDKIAKMFDDNIVQLWNIMHIKLIEGLLFISMLPFHSGKRRRQLAMYCTGIKLLNDIFKKSG